MSRRTADLMVVYVGSMTLLSRSLQAKQQTAGHQTARSHQRGIQSCCSSYALTKLLHASV